MPLPERTPGSPEDWLGRAKGDLALAALPLPAGAFYEDLCFHAKQAAEKAIKGIYRARGLEFRYTHDIEELLDGPAASGLRVPEAVREAASLTIHAADTRYPGPAEPVTEQDHQGAVAAAREIVDWASTLIQGKP